MFGYIRIDKLELKVKEYYAYSAFYCGICHELRQKYGLRGQMTLSYDMTFVAILLSSVYNAKRNTDMERCIFHPQNKVRFVSGEFVTYTADMNILLSYLHMEDDWKDEKKTTAMLGIHALRRAYLSVKDKYPEKCRYIRRELSRLSRLERQNSDHIDEVAGCFGRLFGCIMADKNSAFKKDLYYTGFYLGKYIYILDAYDDLKSDIKKGCYNPLYNMRNEKNFDDTCEKLLTMMMAECTYHFERLPCVKDAEILRNILYSGVWIGLARARRSDKPDENTLCFNKAFARGRRRDEQ